MGGDDRPGQAMRAFMLSVGRGSARADPRKQLGEEYADALAVLSDAPDATLRAHLVLAWLLGIGVVRTVTADEPLSSADPDTVPLLVARAVTVLLERLDG